MKVNTDVDIDVFNRDMLLEKLQHVAARIKRDGDEYVKHNTGVYFQRIPYDPMTNIATIDHKDANDIGYMKIDFLNNSVYKGVRDEDRAYSWFAGRVFGQRQMPSTLLDVACGEGYGSALLAQVADKVVGVDISADVIGHAKARYREQRNVEFLQGSCEELPLADDSVDLAVSFETIEHIETQEQFVRELKRVLKPGGLLVMSSPNKRLYSDARDYHNEFHVRELYRDEFGQLLSSEFPNIRWFNQKLLFHSAIWPDSEAFESTEYLLVTPKGVEVVDHPGVEGMYFVAVCSTGSEALASVEKRLSLLSHSSESVYEDYVYVTRRAINLDRLLTERDQSLSDLSRQREALLERQVELERQLDHRAGWRWWVKSPLRFFRSWIKGSRESASN